MVGVWVLVGPGEGERVLPGVRAGVGIESVTNGVVDVAEGVRSDVGVFVAPCGGE